MGLKAVANPLAGSALPSNVTSASLNSITPTGGELTITGNTVLSPGKYYSALSPDGATRFDALALNGGSADLYSYLGSGTGHFRFLSGDSGGYVIVGIWGRGGLEVTGSIGTTSFIEGAEQTAPAAPAANGYRIFAQDNGAGKTQLMVIFATGAAQQIAIEP